MPFTDCLNVTVIKDSSTVVNFFKQNSYPANFIHNASPHNLHRKQQTQAAVTGDRRRRWENWW